MVDEKQFIQNFADQFDDEPEGLTLETRFRDIDGWSSIIALSEMAMCDEEYDVIISANEMENANCIVDLYNIVNKRYHG
ncbi:MAG: acyl carrier protein [Prevotella sp.]|nr:acyl carrier protein [Prevotella sp.]